MTSLVFASEEQYPQWVYNVSALGLIVGVLAVMIALFAAIWWLSKKMDMNPPFAWALLVAFAPFGWVIWLAVYLLRQHRRVSALEERLALQQ